MFLASASSFAYRCRVPATPAVTSVITLHKTGEDEQAALSLAERIFPDAAVIAPRGDVEEGTRLRFFARAPDGLFDREGWARAGRRLVDFAEDICRPGERRSPLLFGVSHGANTALAALVTDPLRFSGALLIRPAPLPKNTSAPDMSGLPILLISGSKDRTVPLEQSEGLVAVLSDAGARVEREIVVAGHQVDETDISLARTWWSTRAEAGANATGEGS
jgi:phospholipase/carboxylesterase